MNLKPIAKLFRWLWKNRDNIQKVIDTINALKEAVKTGVFVPATDLPAKTGNELTEALMKSDLTHQYNVDKAVFQAQDILFPMSEQDRKQKYEVLAGNYYSVLSKIPFETAVVKIKEEYLKTKLKRV